jgi:hypothetical protein
VLALVLVVAGCAPASTASPGTPSQATAAATPPPTGSPAASPTPTETAGPSGSPVTGLAWATAADVARPADAFPIESAPPSGPAGPGTAGHPGHFPGQAIIQDVAFRDGRWVAVGFVGPDPWRPVSWISDDAEHWSLVEIADAPSDEATFAVAVIETEDGFVAAGRAGRRPAVWTSTDGSDWERHDVPVLGGADAWERISTLAAGREGTLIAGGSVGPELLDRHARFWRSADGGATWTPVPDQQGFDGTEVTAILPTSDGWLALGRIGNGQRTIGSLTWRSTDGTTWERDDDPALGQGWARNLTGPGDGSLVAVGSDTDELAAYAWRSTDEGRTWTRAPETKDLTYEGKIRMTDVLTTPAGFLSVGNVVGMQYGTGMGWISPDGITWTRSGNEPAMGQSEPLAIATDGTRVVAVGSFGAPDNYIPQVWLTPPA